MEEASMNHKNQRHFSGRTFIKTLTLGTGAALVDWDRLTFGGSFVRSVPKNIPVGVQLYSVRREAAKDLPGVLEEIAKMGYKGVEFAGYYGWESKPKVLRRLLDDNGLKCCGTHTGLDTLQGDALKTTAELHTILGNSYLIAPSLSAESADDWMALAETFNEIAEKAATLGMQVGYHAHAGDFRTLGNSTPWEIFFDNTRKDVIMQLDTGNCLAGNGDPVAILKKYPGRSITVHLKEHGGPKGAVIGHGDMPWKETFEVCETTAGTLWYIVEHETGEVPIDDIRGCIEGLRKMGRGLD